MNKAGNMEEVLSDWFDPAQWLFSLLMAIVPYVKMRDDGTLYLDRGNIPFWIPGPFVDAVQQAIDYYNSNTHITLPDHLSIATHTSIQNRLIADGNEDIAKLLDSSEWKDILYFPNGAALAVGLLLILVTIGLFAIAVLSGILSFLAPQFMVITSIVSGGAAIFAGFSGIVAIELIRSSIQSMSKGCERIVVEVGQIPPFFRCRPEC